jgi:hypothetical protein
MIQSGQALRVLSSDYQYAQSPIGLRVSSGCLEKNVLFSSPGWARVEPRITRITLITQIGE